MNRILLTSTALVAFAGAAAADVSFSGSAKLGYNDVVKDGFYWSAGFGIKGSTELNNGLTAGFSADLKVQYAHVPFQQEGAADLQIEGYELYLKSDTAGMYFGDTNNAYESLFRGQRTSGMKVDLARPDDTDVVLRGQAKFGTAEVAVSTHIDLHNGGEKPGAYQAAASYDAGMAKIYAVVQLKDTTGGVEQGFGLAASGTFAGADVAVAYLSEGDDNSMGVKASYPVGPVTLGGYYAANKVNGAEFNNYGLSAKYDSSPITVTAFYDVDSRAAEADEYGFDASYDMSNGLKLFAGVGVKSTGSSNVNAYYVGAKYDLGGDAALMFSYADDGVASEQGKDIGAPEYMEGTTVEISFKF